jgi:hypothetical protein
VSAVTFARLAEFTWDRVKRWARRKHRRITLKTIRRRYCNGGWWPATPEITVFNPAKVGTTRYRYREQPSRPRGQQDEPPSVAQRDLRRARCRDNRHAGFGRFGLPRSLLAEPSLSASPAVRGPGLTGPSMHTRIRLSGPAVPPQAHMRPEKMVIQVT